jgi:hypothetical protein
MALQTEQGNDVFNGIREYHLDPRDFEWNPPPLLTRFQGEQAALLHVPTGAEFHFIYDNDAWSYYYRPGRDTPQTSEKIWS